MDPELDEDGQEAAAPPPASLHIALDPPVKAPGGIDIDELVLREPTAGEMVGVDNLKGYGWTCALVSKVAGVHPKALEQVRVSQLNEASGYLALFIGAARSITPRG